MLSESEIKIKVVSKNVFLMEKKRLASQFNRMTHQTKAEPNIFWAYYNKDEQTFYYCDRVGFKHELDACTLKRYLNQCDTLDSVVNNKPFQDLLARKEYPFPHLGGNFFWMMLATFLAFPIGFSILGATSAWLILDLAGIIPILLLGLGIFFILASLPFLCSEYSSPEARIIFTLGGTIAFAALGVLIGSALAGPLLPIISILVGMSVGIGFGLATFGSFAFFDWYRKECPESISQMSDEKLNTLFYQENVNFMQLKFEVTSTFIDKKTTTNLVSAQPVRTLPENHLTNQFYDVDPEQKKSVVIDPLNAEEIAALIAQHEKPCTSYIYVAYPANLTEEETKEVAQEILVSNTINNPSTEITNRHTITHKFLSALKEKSEEKANLLNAVPITA